MNLPDATRSCLNKYVTFSGRAPRSEFWFFTLACFLFGIVVLAIIYIVPALHVLYFVQILGLFLPQLAVAVRRLHDLNKSGWWYFIILIPLVGAILFLVWMCSRGTDGENDFGADPLASQD